MCSAGGRPTRSEETPALEGGAGSSSPWVTGLCCWAFLPSVPCDPQFPVQEEGYQDGCRRGWVVEWGFPGTLGGWFGFGGTRGQLRTGRVFPQRAPAA